MTLSGPITADWVAVDWGTSNVRAWAMRADGAVTNYTFDYAPDGQNVTVPPVHPNCRCSLRPIIAELAAV